MCVWLWCEREDERVGRRQKRSLKLCFKLGAGWSRRTVQALSNHKPLHRLNCIIKQRSQPEEHAASFTRGSACCRINRVSLYDMASLEDQLKKCNPDKVKLIVTDGVFSMEGDVAKLPEIIALSKKYNCTVMVDEAHGIGVAGYIIY